MTDNRTHVLPAFLLLILATPNLSASSISCLRLLTPKSEFEIEAAFQLKFAKQAAEDQAYLKQLEEHPSETSLNDRSEHILLEREWIASKKRGSYQNHRREKRYRPVLERIAGDILQRQTRKFGDKHIVELKRLHHKAVSLLAGGNPPYKATARFIMLEYLPLLDKILFERHPDLAGRDYHRKNSQHLLEKFLAESPDVYLHFTFESVDDRFFVNTRPSLVNIIGIDLRGLDDISLEPKVVDGFDKGPRKPFADNFEMPISEFAWHDLGHAGFTLFRDLEYLRNSGRPLDRTAAEWEGTNKAILAMVNQAYTNGFEKPDPDLGDAMLNLLFEITRERGYQFSLSILKQELDTQKWVDVIDRKRKANFYSHYYSNDRRFARMEEARLALLRTIGRLKEEAQLRWYAATNPDPSVVRVPVKLTHYPSLVYERGTFQEVRIEGFEKIDVDLKSTTNGKTFTTPIYELASAQVDPTKNSPFTTEVNLHLNVVMMMKQQKLDSISHVELTPARHLMVVMTSGQKIGLSDYIKGHSEMIIAYERFADNQVKMKKIKARRSDQAPLLPHKMDPFSIFKMEQLIGTNERKEAFAFTVRPPTKVYYGRIHIERNLMTGHYVVHIKTVHEQLELTLPLTEVRIDTWDSEQ